MRAISSSRFRTRTRCEDRASRTSYPASRGNSTLSPGSTSVTSGPTDATIPLRTCVASFAGTIRPLGSSDSSRGSTTRQSSSGSSVTFAIGCPPNTPSRYSAHPRHEPRQAVLPRARPDEGGSRLLLRRRRGPRAAAPSPPAVPHEAVPERRRRRVLPPEARTREAPRLRRRGLRAIPERALDGLRDRRQRGGARLGREPRLHRAPHVGVAGARDRAARLPPDRPRSDERGTVAARARDRARRPGGHGLAWAAVV